MEARNCARSRYRCSIDLIFNNGEHLVFGFLRQLTIHVPSQRC